MSPHDLCRFPAQTFSSAGVADQADSPEEVTAFLYATLDRLPPENAKLQLSRCIIASTPDAAVALGKSSTPLAICQREK
jgi:hypothetical protein